MKCIKDSLAFNLKHNCNTFLPSTCRFHVIEASHIIRLVKKIFGKKLFTWAQPEWESVWFACPD